MPWLIRHQIGFGIFWGEVSTVLSLISILYKFHNVNDNTFENIASQTFSSVYMVVTQNAYYGYSCLSANIFLISSI